MGLANTRCLIAHAVQFMAAPVKLIAWDSCLKFLQIADSSDNRLGQDYSSGATGSEISWLSFFLVIEEDAEWIVLP